jgi:hypothetical protein
VRPSSPIRDVELGAFYSILFDPKRLPGAGPFQCDDLHLVIESLKTGNTEPLAQWMKDHGVFYAKGQSVKQLGIAQKAAWIVREIDRASHKLQCLKGAINDGPRRSAVIQELDELRRAHDLVLSGAKDEGEAD